MIIYIHGFASSGNSSKVDLLRQLLHQHDEQIKVYAPTYSSDDPALGIRQLTAYVRSVIRHLSEGEELMFVGTSLGAYFARYLAEQFHGKVVLINPVFKPEQMEPMLGYNRFLDTGERFYIGERFMAELVKCYVFKSHVSTLVLLDQGDEQFNVDDAFQFFKNNAKIISYPGGSHRFDHLQESITSILQEYYG